MITGAQIRSARAALGWSAQTLAEKSGVGLRTVMRFEQNHGVPPSRSSNLQELQRCFEAAGIQFVGSPDNWPGVRFPATVCDGGKGELKDLFEDTSSATQVEDK